MNRLLKLFGLQTLVVVVVAIPVSLYLRSDYREFQTKKQLASEVPAGVGAVCRDGWYSRSTGSGTCSHHGGVRYWGAELRQIAQASWLADNSVFFVILAAGLIGWYAYGARAIHRRHSNASQISTSKSLQRQCCTDSSDQGLRFCAVCGAALNEEPRAALSPAMTYGLLTVTALLTIALTVIGVVYLRNRRSAEATAALSPSPSPTPIPSPTLTPTPNITPTPEDLNLEGLVEPDPLEEVVRSAKETPTPTPDPIIASRERTVSSPSPRPTTRTESIVYASDVLIAGYYGRPEERRTYRFHLSQRARVKGSFSARGNISVYISGYYSSGGAISSDSIDVIMPAGSYEVIISARESVSFNLRLMAHYDE